MATEERFDIIILGASGFSGMLCIPYLYKLAKEKNRNLSWAISGRSNEKLKKTLDNISSKIGVDLSHIPIILADIKDYGSLVKMAQKTNNLINCCGPYRLLGEPVIKACIEAGTHYIDIAAERQFIETCQVDYHELAKEKGLYIINACGVDCIPCDLGLTYTQNKFDGTLHSAVAYICVHATEENIPGPVLNFATWASVGVNDLRDTMKLSNLIKRFFPERLPTFTPKFEPRMFPYRPKLVDGWALPIPTCDEFVMKKTQKYLYENENRRPIQVDTKVVLKKNFFQILGGIFFALIWLLLVKFNFGRRLLLNYPHILTLGFVRKDQQPSEKQMSVYKFETVFYGEGWKEKLPSKNDQYSYPPNRSVVTKIKCEDGGYALSSACVAGAAIVIATEKDKLPASGGVYTPGIAFGKTSLIELLDKIGVCFEVIYSKDL